MSTIVVQLFDRSHSIKKHIPIIKESILAFYSGLKNVATSSLIPIVENILDTIIEKGSNIATSRTLIDKVNNCLDLAIENVKNLYINNVDWIPEEYTAINFLKVMDERIFFLDVLKSWMINSFYKNTYSNHSNFNRHIFAHAKSNLWHNPNNFFRSIGLIQALAFVECFALKDSKVGVFTPNPNKHSNSFLLDIKAVLDKQHIIKTLYTHLKLEHRSPFNETSPNDDWLYIANILSNDMNDKIIPALQSKEWQCHSFTDPIENGHYITVQAEKGDRTIKIALLASCASDNMFYKKLDSTCDYILYYGAYYRQDSFAYGINAEVLPLNAWLAPDK